MADAVESGDKKREGLGIAADDPVLFRFADHVSAGRERGKPRKDIPLQRITQISTFSFGEGPDLEHAVSFVVDPDPAGGGQRHQKDRIESGSDREGKEGEKSFQSGPVHIRVRSGSR